MPEGEWILVSRAARSIRIADACALINWAWRRRYIPLRGVPIGGGELVDIPATEGGKIDCRKSRVVTGRLFTTHEHVITRWADLERLAQVRAPASHALNTADVTPAAGASSPPVSEALVQQPPQSAARVEETPPPWVTQLVKFVAAILLREWPKGRPQKTVDGMLQHLHDNYPKTKIGTCGKTTVERAIRWLQLQGRWDRQPVNPFPD
jgi:hypothetical protein